MLKSYKNHLFSLIAFALISTSIQVNATEKGLFWKLESPAGVTSYLFGTMHTDDNRVTDFSPKVFEAMKTVDTFMMEGEPLQDQSMLMMKEGSIIDIVTEAELEKVNELADFHVMHREAAMRMKPWLLAVIFDLPKPQTPYAQDSMLMTESEKYVKNVVGIESAQEHFGIMDDFSQDEQLVMLRAVLKRTAAQKEKDFERLLAAYLEGDSDKISALDEQITGGMLPKPLWAKMRANLLDNRNLVMAERTVKLANEKPVFVAVGASHLAGENGLIAAFKKAGYKLTAVK